MIELYKTYGELQNAKKKIVFDNALDNINLIIDGGMDVSLQLIDEIILQGKIDIDTKVKILSDNMSRMNKKPLHGSGFKIKIRSRRTGRMNSPGQR